MFWKKETETPHFLRKNPPYFTKKAKRLDYHVKPQQMLSFEKKHFYLQKKQPYQN